MLKQSLTLLIFYFIQLPIFAQWFWQNPLPQGNSLYDNHFETTDGGKNWIKQDFQGSVSFTELVAVDQDKAWLVGTAGTILHTNNGGFVGVNNSNLQNNGYSATNYPNPFNDHTNFRIEKITGDC